MECSWKGIYKGGEIEIRASTLQEIDEQISTILKHGEGSTPLKPVANQVQIPQLEGATGCSEAVRVALGSEWGRTPRTMAELQPMFELSALFFSAGTLSGVLNHLTRSGQVRRLEKEGRWAYVLVR